MQHNVYFVFFYFLPEFSQLSCHFFFVFCLFLYLVFKFMIQGIFHIPKCLFEIYNSFWRVVLQFSSTSPLLGEEIFISESFAFVLFLY